MARVSTMLPLLSNDLDDDVGSVGSEGRQVFAVRGEDGAARLCDCDNDGVDGRTSTSLRSQVGRTTGDALRDGRADVAGVEETVDVGVSLLRVSTPSEY